MFLLFCPLFSRGTSERSEASSQTRRSAFLGGPGGILVSDKRTNPQGRILTGGAEKAERRQEQGAAQAERARENKEQKMDVLQIVG
jgi:hypothetical protein